MNDFLDVWIYLGIMLRLVFNNIVFIIFYSIIQLKIRLIVIDSFTWMLWWESINIIKWSIRIPIGPITRSKNKKIKEKINRQSQDIWVNKLQICHIEPLCAFWQYLKLHVGFHCDFNWDRNKTSEAFYQYMLGPITHIEKREWHV